MIMWLPASIKLSDQPLQEPIKRAPDNVLNLLTGPISRWKEKSTKVDLTGGWLMNWQTLLTVPQQSPITQSTGLRYIKHR